MMFKGLKKSTSKITAAVLAVVMLLTMIPFGTLVNAFAATVDSYTVTLTDGSSAINLDGVEITLTNKADASKSSVQNTSNGVATFENFVEEEETYTVSVAEKTGYEAVADFEITPATGETNSDVNLVAIDKVELKGTVVDENGNPYNGATVKVTGYITETAVTGYDGTYSFSAYKGKDYTVTATAKEEKYEKASTEITNLSETQPASELRFKVKEFKITTSATDSNGLVTDSDNVKYGENKTITATAKDGYCINSFKVDGVEQLDATAKKGFTYSFSNITDSHSVSVSFKRQTYKISFTVDENGKVEYTEGTKQVVAGGSVNIDKEFNESEDPSNPTKVIVDAIPNDTYRVSKIVVDGVEQTFTENDKKVEGTEFAMTEDHTFVVEFKLNQYDININNGSGKEGEVTVLGSSNSNNAKANHGDNLEFQIKNIQGYVIKEIKVNNAITDYEYDNDKAAYVVAVNNVDGNIDFDVSYEINDKLYSFKENVKVEIKNGKDKKSIVFNDGTTELNSLGELNNNNTDGMVIKTEGNTIVLKSGSEIIFTNKNVNKWNSNYNIELQFVYSQFKRMNDKGWYNPGSSQVIVSESCELSNIQVHTKDQEKNTINPEDKISALEQPIKYTIIIDNTKPEVSLTESNFNWTNSNNVNITGTVSDKNEPQNPSSGLSHIVWSKGSTMTLSEVLAETENKVAITNGEFSFNSVNGEQNVTYYVYAVDVADNVSDAKTVEVKIDTKLPTVTEFKFSTKENTVVQDIISFLTFGTICSEKMYVTVVANDETITSGLKDITLYRDGAALATKKVTDNYAIFELKESEFKNGAELSAVVTDNAGNTSVITKPTDIGALSNEVKIDGSTKPVATITPATSVYTDATGKLWYDGNLALTIVAKDENTGIRKVSVQLNGKDITTDINNKAINTNFSASRTTEETFVINTSQNALDGENVIEVVVTNNSDIESVKAVQKVYIDTTKPDISKFEIAHTGDTPLDKVLNFLTFGMFFDDKVEVTVTASDSNATSGVKTITLYVDGTPFKTKTVTDDKATFVIPGEAITDNTMHFDKVISAKAVDFVGYETANFIEPNTSNSDIQNSGLMIETIKPTISVGCADAVQNKNSATADANDWYKEDVEFTVDVADADAGIRNVNISINDTTLVNEDLYATEVHSKQYKVKTSDSGVVRAADGSYTIKVVVIDNAGNASETYSKTIYKDIDKPYITGFDFDAVDFVEGSETASTVEVTDYGFYFKADTKVTISAKDNAPSAGVKSITYYTVDKDAGKSTENTVNVNKDGQIEFTIEANFKGQIYAKATDNVDNVADQFVNPNSAIVEDETKHKEETHIIFTKDDTEFTINDGENKELYANDVPVKFTVIDTYSGIRSIEWSVVAPYDTANNQSGKITVNNDKTFTSDSEEGWTIVDQESNLVTKMEKDIVVKNNSNNIVITVKMIDRAGNSSEDTIEFSIDKTIPTIEVVYDNNEADEEYKDIYKADREATITVTERNFRAEDIVYEIKNSDKVIPTVVLTNADVWTTTVNDEDPDKTVHVAKIKYTADGDYTFDIAYKDNAENAAEAFAQHAFTIDKTMPAVTVTYDNNSVLNGNYYKADRTATITIVEHNFDSSRVNVIGTATDNGTNLSFPTTSSWTDNGDTHVATINYSYDAKFIFDIEFLDMAGNSIADYTPEEFFVDKIAPTLEISGVEDKSANNGTVAPIVTYTDTNFNKDAVTIELIGVNNGKVNYAASTKDIDNGQEYAYADFDKVQEVDDIYTLSATLTDKAGNETKKEIMFSANRFGSVYTFDTYLKNIEGKYTNAEQDVVFTETNVDTLDHESILLKLFKDGTPTDLKEGQDYTVTHTGGDGKWSQYEYVVSKELFANDGKYRMTVYSKDRAGNVNENIEESKKAEISFGIDKTKPVIVPIDFESGKQYPVEVKTVKAEIKDNLVLENVKIYLGEEKAENEIKYTVDGETYTFDIPQSNEKQTVIFVATDAASNEYKLSVEDFLVSTNIFVRWYNNTPLFIGSIIGVVVLAVGLAAFLIFGKKKKKDDEDEKEKF